MVIRVSVSPLAASSLERKVTRAAANRAFRTATFLADRMEIHVVQVVREKFVTDRPSGGKLPRHKKNTPHLINSFRGFVEGGPNDLPIDAVLGIKRGVNEKKIAALEYGSPPHAMQGVPWLAWPRDVSEEGFLDREDQRRRLRNAYGRPGRGGNKIFATQEIIVHPGNKPYGMMAEARRRARQDLKRR
jgi:hypothetical protein